MTEFFEPVAPPNQRVSYSYWPVIFWQGDMFVTGNVPLPLSGVQFSNVMRGAGELRASLQLADPRVRALDPWSKVVPRKTGIVVVRTVTNPANGVQVHTVPWSGIVWAAPPNPATGRMEITANTVESLWARRLITGPPRPDGWVPSVADPGDLSWRQVDQQQIAADLLDPAKFSQLPAGPANLPGWVTVSPPTTPTGVLRDHSYARDQQTNLLEAHQDRSTVIGGYEWHTETALLAGVDALSATSFRSVFVLGYPRLGREFGVAPDVPSIASYRDGRGSVTSWDYVNDGTNTPNALWGNGSGYEGGQTRSLTTNNAELGYGFLRTEDKYSNPDVSDVGTLQGYTNAELLRLLGSERYLAGVTLRGDLPPYFGSYRIGDDFLFNTDAAIFPDNLDGGRHTTLLTRCMGWTVTPPEGNNGERVELLLAGGGRVG